MEVVCAHDAVTVLQQRRLAQQRVTSDAELKFEHSLWCGGRPLVMQQDVQGGCVVLIHHPPQLPPPEEPPRPPRCSIHQRLPPEFVEYLRPPIPPSVGARARPRTASPRSTHLAESMNGTWPNNYLRAAPSPVETLKATARMQPPLRQGREAHPLLLDVYSSALKQMDRDWRRSSSRVCRLARVGGLAGRLSEASKGVASAAPALKAADTSEASADSKASANGEASADSEAIRWKPASEHSDYQPRRQPPPRPSDACSDPPRPSDACSGPPRPSDACSGPPRPAPPLHASPRPWRDESLQPTHETLHAYARRTFAAMRRKAAARDTREEELARVYRRYQSQAAGAYGCVYGHDRIEGTGGSAPSTTRRAPALAKPFQKYF